jgi:hypothetical protein
MRYLVLILISACCIAKGAPVTFPNGQQWVQQFKSILGNGSLAQGTTATTNLTTTSAGSSYGVGGTNLSTTIFEAEISLDSSQAVSTNSHAGIAIRYSDTLNFASMALITVGQPGTGGVFQHIDRVGGTEYYTVEEGLSITHGTHYRIRVSNTSGDSYTVSLLSADGNTTISTLSGTHQAGVPATGLQATHTYSCDMSVYWVTIKDGSGNLLVDGTGSNHFINPLAANTTYVSAVASGGVLTLDANAASPNAWRAVLFPVNAENFTMTGTMNRTSGRLQGICFRTTSDGTGYNFEYDDNANVLRLLGGTINTGSTIASSSAVTLNTGVDYPFTVTVAGSSLGFTVNGVTLSVTDTTYTGANWIGVTGLSSVGTWKDIQIYPHPTEWFVATDGSIANSGSISAPWTLQYALTNTLAAYGDTIWVRGGAYSGLLSALKKSPPEVPVVVRNYNKEAVSLNGGIDLTTSSNLWIWGFEFYWTDKATDSQEVIKNGTYGTRIINCYFHDCNQGMGGGPYEAYGNVMQHIGASTLEHPIYWQNTGVVPKIVEDNLISSSTGFGVHAFSSGGPLIGYRIIGNAIWGLDEKQAILIGGGTAVSDAVISSNQCYTTSGIIVGYSLNNNGDVTITHNKTVGKIGLKVSQPFDSFTVTDNVINGDDGVLWLLTDPSATAGPHSWDNNQYYWFRGALDPVYWLTGAIPFATWKSNTGFDANSTITVTGSTSFPASVMVRTNRYEAKRANVVIWNMAKADNVDVDFSSFLSVGDSYRVISADNYSAGAIRTGTYSGGNVSLPMTNLTVAPWLYYSHADPVNTTTNFGAFVVIGSGAGSVHATTTRAGSLKGLTGPPPPSTLNDGLVAYWKLDEASGTRVDSGPNGQNLTDNNTVTSDTGKISNAGLFVSANSEYLSRTDSTELSTGNIDFSFSCWFYQDAAVANSAILTKGSAYSNANLEYALWLGSGGATPAFSISDGTTTTTISSGVALTASTWYHIVVSYDAAANQMAITINAGTPATTAQSTGPQDTTGAFGIGRRNNGAYISGRVDEVGFWKRVLTSDERTELYNAGAGKTYPF